jgi:hypothetical protein
MRLTTIAALAAVLLALSACSNEDIGYLTALAVGEPVPDYAAGSLTIAEIIEDERDGRGGEPPSVVSYSVFGALAPRYLWAGLWGGSFALAVIGGALLLYRRFG